MILFLAILVLLTGLENVRAQTNPIVPESGIADETALSQRMTQAVLKALQDSQWLEQQIERGVERYIKKQQAASKTVLEEKTRQFQAKAKHVRPVSATRDHIWGNPEAPVSLIEYSDFECPFCKRFHPTPKHIVDASKGTINWVYRHFPLPKHNPSAQKQAEATECANELGGNAVFWQYADAIYTRTTSNGNGFPPGKLALLATELGIDASAFHTCLESDRHADRVMEDLEEGKRIGITGTPATFIRFHPTGNVRVTTGVAQRSALLADIQQVVANDESTAAQK